LLTKIYNNNQLILEGLIRAMSQLTERSFFWSKNLFEHRTLNVLSYAGWLKEKPKRL